MQISSELGQMLGENKERVRVVTQDLHFCLRNCNVSLQAIDSASINLFSPNSEKHVVFRIINNAFGLDGKLRNLLTEAKVPFQILDTGNASVSSTIIIDTKDVELVSTFCKSVQKAVSSNPSINSWQGLDSLGNYNLINSPSDKSPSTPSPVLTTPTFSAAIFSAVPSGHPGFGNPNTSSFSAPKSYTPPTPQGQPMVQVAQQIPSSIPSFIPPQNQQPVMQTPGHPQTYSEIKSQSGHSHNQQPQTNSVHSSQWQPQPQLQPQQPKWDNHPPQIPSFQTPAYTPPPDRQQQPAHQTHQSAPIPQKSDKEKQIQTLLDKADQSPGKAKVNVLIVEVKELQGGRFIVDLDVTRRKREARVSQTEKDDIINFVKNIPNLIEGTTLKPRSGELTIPDQATFNLFVNYLRTLAPGNLGICSTMSKKIIDEHKKMPLLLLELDPKEGYKFSVTLGKETQTYTGLGGVVAYLINNHKFTHADIQSLCQVFKVELMTFGQFIFGKYDAGLPVTADDFAGFHCTVGNKFDSACWVLSELEQTFAFLKGCEYKALFISDSKKAHINLLVEQYLAILETCFNKYPDLNENAALRSMAEKSALMQSDSGIFGSKNCAEELIKRFTPLTFPQQILQGIKNGISPESKDFENLKNMCINYQDAWLAFKDLEDIYALVKDYDYKIGGFSKEQKEADIKVLVEVYKSILSICLSEHHDHQKEFASMAEKSPLMKSGSFFGGTNYAAELIKPFMETTSFFGFNK